MFATYDTPNPIAVEATVSMADPFFVCDTRWVLEKGKPPVSASAPDRIGLSIGLLCVRELGASIT